MREIECSHYEPADGDCLTNACGGCCVKYRAELDALRAENERLRALLREVAECGVESADERVRYVAVQIDADTWARVKAITVPAEEDGRDAS